MPPRLLSMPDTPMQQISLAISAAEAAWRSGVRLQAIEILLPLTFATDLDDWCVLSNWYLGEASGGQVPFLEKGEELGARMVAGGDVACKAWREGLGYSCRDHALPFTVQVSDR